MILDKFTDGFRRKILVFAGTTSVCIGILGVFLPVLPTTPFLLFAAACYARSSAKFYDWLMNNKMLGSYIRDYRDMKGMRLSSKIMSISMLNVLILYSVIWGVENAYLRVTLLIIAISVTSYLVFLKTIKD